MDRIGGKVPQRECSRIDRYTNFSYVPSFTWYLFDQVNHTRCLQVEYDTPARGSLLSPEIHVQWPLEDSEKDNTLLCSLSLRNVHLSLAATQVGSITRAKHHVVQRRACQRPSIYPPTHIHRLISFMPPNQAEIKSPAPPHSHPRFPQLYIYTQAAAKTVSLTPLTIAADTSMLVFMVWTCGTRSNEDVYLREEGGTGSTCCTGSTVGCVGSMPSVGRY